MNITRVGVDIAKSVFHVYGVDCHDQPQWRGKYSRDKWLHAIVKRVPAGAEIGMEACATSHYWARELQVRGYQVKLMAAQFVKPYCSGQVSVDTCSSRSCQLDFPRPLVAVRGRKID
ncbi:hypothetical protein GCM10007159_41220 [Modicisalibacter luteus]|nr:IS110 family transposase [Halomonas lutea]GHB14595.1 hypothetical protein GCM10007159_41220 [Halomonas lutea]